MSTTMVSRLGSQPGTSATPALTVCVDPCKRCLRKDPVPACTVISRGEAFCTPCFDRFVVTKARKQLGDESYKPLYLKDKTPVETTAHVLVPVLACTARDGLQRARAGLMVVEMMAEIIRGHRKAHRGRQGMYLHVLEVGLEENDRDSGVQDLLKARYTENEITDYTFTSLESFFSTLGKDEETADGSLWSTLQIDTLRNDSPKPPRSLAELMSVLPSKTSRADVQTIILSRLISASARQKGCQTVFQPHTLTYLAERAMAAVCKGRGIELGTSLTPAATGRDGLIEIQPLADLYNTEVKSYLDLRGLDLPAQLQYLAAQGSSASTATKALSMDQLLSNYFEDIDAAFPSVTTTVVRTVEKLASPFEVPGHPASTAGEDLCKVCSARRQTDTLSWLHKISVMELDVTPAKTAQVLAQGPQDLCYSCIVAFRNSNASHIMWPAVDNEPRNKKEDVLEEYEL